MGARDGAIQGVLPHMIYDARTRGIQILYTSSTEDHKLILGTHNMLQNLCSLDGRPRDALNRKNVEAAAAPSSSFYHMQSNSDSHGQHQICLEREI